MEEQSKVKLCVKLHTGKLCLRKNQSCTINTYGDLSHMTLKLKIEMHYSRCQLVEEKHKCKKCCPLRRIHRGVIGRENTFFSFFQKRQVSEKIMVQERSCRGGISTVFQRSLSAFICSMSEWGGKERIRSFKAFLQAVLLSSFLFLLFFFFFFSTFLSQSICCKLDLEKNMLTSSSLAYLLGSFSIFMYCNPWSDCLLLNKVLHLSLGTF